ncbi:MAG TPA: glutamate--tRNA ligase [Bacteroidota bacterium]
MPPIRVRFAPSPTGYLHVGGLRTALYNYLFAKKNKGTFVLRIEDTDRTRLVEGAVENLVTTLEWAGLKFDEGPNVGGKYGPYVQSERLEIYQEHARKLLSEGKAYYAFDTPDELEEMRKTQEKMRVPPKYDRRALQLSEADVKSRLDSGVPHVVRMKIPETSTIVVDDIVRGRVEFVSDRLDDQVLLKSDGFPTYHLANVVDDSMMGITHVIRGEEWLSSTPKHVLLYEYFGWDKPAFAHLPLLLNPDKSKLSKRQGDVAVEDYRQKGYFPEALANFVALLGWNPGDEREIFSLQDLVKEFSLERVGKSGAVFNLEKLRWMNTQHLRLKSDEELFVLLEPHLATANFYPAEKPYVLNVIHLMKERVDNVEEFISFGGYFFADPEAYDEQAKRKNWKPESSTYLADAILSIRGLAAFDEKSIEEVVRTIAEKHGVGAGKLIHPIRLALTGVGLGPGLFELMAVLGKETCLRRLEQALSRLA